VSDIVAHFRKEAVESHSRANQLRKFTTIPSLRILYGIASLVIIQVIILMAVVSRHQEHIVSGILQRKKSTFLLTIPDLLTLRYIPDMFCGEVNGQKLRFSLVRESNETQNSNYVGHDANMQLERVSVNCSECTANDPVEVRFTLEIPSLYSQITRRDSVPKLLCR